jgi:phytoene dehydrogenase-like protein
MNKPLDAIVVGAGPNGLAAAITLAKHGKRVRVYEANEVVGGSVRSAAITLPGFLHDICSAVHPLGVGAPFFQSLPLEKYGLEFIHSPARLAHPFDDGSALLLYRSVDQTIEQLGDDARAYRNLLHPLVNNWHKLSRDLLGPLEIPHHPFALARFGLLGIRSASTLIRSRFRDERTRAFFAGLAAHSCLSLDQLGTAAFGLILAVLGHTVGWPIPRGGSQQISDALAAHFQDLNGEIVTGSRIESIGDLPPAHCVLFDVTPRQLLQIAGERLRPGFRRRLSHYRYGTGAFKMDWALAGPVPWRAAECREAATVHLGGSLAEIEESESAIWKGQCVERPYVIVAQPSLFDSSRAPEGKHTLWAYCHVPHGSTVDMSERIENQIERFAPGFRSLILARRSMSPAQLESYNANLVGGDISGGAQTIAQLFTRPTISTYSTPLTGVYICSSSTPPGGGVHGMCGYHAARTALRKSFGERVGE